MRVYFLLITLLSFTLLSCGSPETSASFMSNEAYIQNKSYFPSRPNSPILSIDQDFRPAARLSPAEVNADIDQYIKLLQNSYSGRLFIPKDYTKLVQRLGALKKRIDILNSAALCKEIGLILNQVPDFHTGVDYRQNDLTWKSCLARANPVGTVGTNLASASTTPYAISKKVINGKNVLLLGIKTLAVADNDPIWQKLLSEFKAALPGTDSIILDLRGNTGGGTYATENLARLIAVLPVVTPGQAPKIPTPQIGNSWNQINTPTAYAVRADSYVFTLLDQRDVNHQPITPANLAILKKMTDQYQSSITKPEPTIFTRITPNLPPIANPAFKGKTFILIDQKCASSCELTLDYFEKIKNTTLVGEHTRGAIHTTFPGKALLENSHVRVKIPTVFINYVDHRNLETKGHKPHVPVAAGKDALTAALSLIH